MARTTTLRWLIGATVGALAVLVFAPPSGWLVRNQLRLALGGRNPEVAPKNSAVLDGRVSAASGYPSDLRMQIAAAVASVNRSDERAARLRALARPYQENYHHHGRGRSAELALLQASIIRFACMDLTLGIRREEDITLTGDRLPANFHWERANRGLSSKFEYDVMLGEKADPYNAFFPFMRSANYFANRQDNLALDAIRRASTKPVWNEYFSEEAIGQIRMAEAAFGPRPGIVKIALFAAILLPQYSVMRSSARIAIAKAIQAEQEGRLDDCLRIRKHIAIVGTRLRMDGASLISNMVGRSIANLAAVRPGGELAPRKSIRKLSPEEDLKVVESSRERFYAYLRDHGRTEEVSWFRARFEPSDEIKRIADYTEHSAFSTSSMLNLIAWWGVNLALIASALFMLLICGAASLLCRTHPIRVGTKVPAPVQLGMFTAAAFSAVLVDAVTGHSGTLVLLTLAALTAVVWRGWVPALALPAVAACGYMVLRGWAPPTALTIVAITSAGIGFAISRRPEKKQISLFLLAASVSLGITLLVLGVGEWLTAGIRELDGTIEMFVPESGVRITHVPSIVGMALAIPLAVGVLLAALSLFNRVPVGTGLCRGFRGLGVPLACLLAIGYCFSVLGTLRHEKSVSEGLDKSVMHEGRYVAELSGIQWPGIAESVRWR